MIAVLEVVASRAYARRMAAFRSLFTRHWVGVFLALTLVSRVLIPAGYMIAPASAGGTPMIVVCSGNGPMMMASPAMTVAGHTSGDEKGQHDGARHDHPCAFASASAAVDLTSVTHPAMPVGMPNGPVTIDPLAPRPGLGLAAPPPPKTGPPLPR